MLATAYRMNRPLVSVVVPTCGRLLLLARCLDALYAQTLPASCYEVIVIDDSPDGMKAAGVAACCEQARERGLPLRCLRNPGQHGQRGPAAARNLGWRAARAAWVGFTDDDTIAQPDWLERACAAFTSGGDEGAPDALRGRVQVPLQARPTDYERDAARLQDAGFVTANCFCRRAMLLRVGGFDERFRAAWREDTDLYFRLCDAGARVACADDAVVLHPVRPGGWSVSLAQQRKILFDALLYKKHRQRYRQQIRHAPRWDYYLNALALAAAGAGLLAGTPAWAAAGASAWLLSSGVFFARRLRGTSRAPVAVGGLLVTSLLIPPLAVFWRAVGALRFRVALL